MPHCAAFLYLDDGLAVSTNPYWQQGAFDTLIRVFIRVGIRTNVRKKVGILCRPFRAVLMKLEADYKRWMMGEGLTYHSHQWIRLKWPYCGVDLESG